MAVFGASLPDIVLTFGFQLPVDVPYREVSPESSTGESEEIISRKRQERKAADRTPFLSLPFRLYA